MKKVILKILAFLLILAALGWLLYPTVANELARKEKLEKTEKYLRAVRVMKSETLTRMLDDADEANGITPEFKEARAAAEAKAAEEARKAEEEKAAAEARAAALEAAGATPEVTATPTPEPTPEPTEVPPKEYRINEITGEAEFVYVTAEPTATPTATPEPTAEPTAAALPTDAEVEPKETALPGTADGETTGAAEAGDLIRPGDVFTAHAERSSTRYRNLLDFGDGIIGVLEIPSIHVSIPIEHINTDVRPDKALVHVEGSSLPGETGNTHTVLAGPRKQKAPGILGDLALTGDRMLEDLDRVTPGDQMMILLGNRTLLYEVYNVQTLSPEGLKGWVAERDPEEDRLTLITERDGRRLLVEAVRIRIREATEKLQAEDSAKLPADWITILALGCPVLLLTLLIMFVIERIKKHAYRLPGEKKNPDDIYNDDIYNNEVTQLDVQMEEEDGNRNDGSK